MEAAEINKELDAEKRHEEKNNTFNRAKASKSENADLTHMCQEHAKVYCKRCSKCDRAKLFEKLCRSQTRQTPTDGYR